jgi:hypothetical protein
MPADTHEREYGATTAALVTPNDSTDLAIGFTRGIYIGGTGNLSVVMIDGQTITFPSVGAGSILPLCVSRIRATNTTATNIIALK